MYKKKQVHYLAVVCRVPVNLGNDLRVSLIQLTVREESLLHAMTVHMWEVAGYSLSNSYESS